MNLHSRNDKQLGDYCDGTQYSRHPLFASDPHALQIILYYDDLQVSNVIGSHTKNHKLGKVYGSCVCYIQPAKIGRD